MIQRDMILNLLRSNIFLCDLNFTGQYVYFTNFNAKIGGMMLEKINILFLFLFLLLLGLFTPLLASESECACDYSDNCGKIVGQLIDAETNLIITEPFRIVVFQHYQNEVNLYLHRECMVVETYNGNFSVNLKEGRYIVLFFPISKTTNYTSMYYHPRFPQKEIRPISVEKGKISKIQKKIKKNGELKIVLKNTDGTKFNFRDIFKVGSLNIALSIDKIGYQDMRLMNENEILSGEMILRNLMPGDYQIMCFFYQTGYGKSKTDFIKIDSNKTTIYDITIDVSDQTGIYGNIRTVDGIAVTIGELNLYKKIEGYGDKSFATAIPDDTGYYKIFGVPDGDYILRVESKYGEVHLKDVIIKKDQLLLKDIIIQNK